MDGPLPPSGIGCMYPCSYQFEVVVDNLSLEFGSTFFVPAQAAEFQHTQATYARSHYSFSVALRAGRGLEIAYKRFARSKTAVQDARRLCLPIFYLHKPYQHIVDWCLLPHGLQFNWSIF